MLDLRNSGDTKMKSNLDLVSDCDKYVISYYIRDVSADDLQLPLL